MNVTAEWAHPYPKTQGGCSLRIQLSQYKGQKRNPHICTINRFSSDMRHSQVQLVPNSCSSQHLRDDLVSPGRRGLTFSFLMKLRGFGRQRWKEGLAMALGSLYLWGVSPSGSSEDATTIRKEKARGFWRRALIPQDPSKNLDFTVGFPSCCETAKAKELLCLCNSHKKRDYVMQTPKKA